MTKQQRIEHLEAQLRKSRRDLGAAEAEGHRARIAHLEAIGALAAAEAERDRLKILLGQGIDNHHERDIFATSSKQDQLHERHW